MTILSKILLTLVSTCWEILEEMVEMPSDVWRLFNVVDIEVLLVVGASE